MSEIWRCGRFELALDEPLIMGIINVTPDSFSDGGERENPADAVAWGEQLVAEGAHIIDIGGESTRPGSEAVPVPAEIARVRPVVTRLAESNMPISIDTRRPDVARACVECGASIINDVSGMSDPAMLEVAAGCEAGVIVMHMLGEPKTMQEAPVYDDVVTEVEGFLLGQVSVLEAAGIASERIAIDPGIGFGKTYEHNISLLRAIPRLASHGYPVVIGASRKRFIGEITGEDAPRRRAGGSVAAAMEAVRLGAAVVRVHDVGATVQALAVARAIQGR
ncbi:MAG TPA: dihydropteroate synthase [Coriobacteriia bacterium]|nr:dihydropteroate synthase [Coriobacteriia bacterium]